jgi:hypothetical protein
MLLRDPVTRLASVLFLGLGLIAPSAAMARSWDGRTLFSSEAYHVEYPRAIRLAKKTILVAFPIYYDINVSVMRFSKSTDGGRTFQFVTDFADPEPLDIGAPALLKAPDGSVLFAYNLMDSDAFSRGQKIKVWRSTDEGATWEHVSTPEPGGKWCWEPEFVIAEDGALQLYYSYAGRVMNTFKQHIVRRETTDGGATWSDPVVAVGDTRNHVGMARVVRTEDRFLMAFEHYESFGAVRIVESADGKTWSSVRDASKMEIAGDGWMFSTPSLAYVGGALVGMGKQYLDQTITGTFESDENEGTVLLRSGDGGRSWQEICSPFTIRYADFSSNWSPTLLPIGKTRVFLVTNSDLEDLHRIQYGIGSTSNRGRACGPNGTD